MGSQGVDDMGRRGNALGPWDSFNLKYISDCSNGFHGKKSMSNARIFMGLVQGQPFVSDTQSWLEEMKISEQHGFGNAVTGSC